MKKLNCKYVIIGHSERRIYNKEENKLIKKKVEIVNRHKLTPILCVGEELEIRKKRITKILFLINWKNVYQKNARKLLLLMNRFGLLVRVKLQHQ